MFADFFISLINLIISGLGALASSILKLLPNSPFSSVRIETISQKLLGHLSWVVPFQSILVIFNSSLVVVGSYYIYQTILRWIKAIK